MSEPAHALQPRRLNAAGASDRGRVRTSNEDRFHVDAEHGIFLVADGVGGHAAGEVAASIAVDVIIKRLERPIWTARQRVREAIALANNEIHRQAESSPEHAGMTCVLTLALVSGRQLTIGHVGDSRLYLVSPEGIRKLTHDHSPVGEREDAQELSEAEAMRHPRRNEVFRDVGSVPHDPDDEEFIEVVETTFDEDSAILLCSDGLTDLVPAAAIDRLVRHHAGDPRATLEALIGAANEAGGKDNITVVLAEGEGFSRAVAAATAGGASGSADSRPGPPAARSSARATLLGRATWLAFGILLGLLLGLGLSIYTSGLDRLLGTRSRQTLVVGGTAAGNYPSIAAAMAAAAPRDLIRIEPGEYAEGVTLKDGVDLVASVPGTVSLVAPPGNPAWTAITVEGRAGNHIEGLRVVGRPDAPLSVGLRLAGQNTVVDDVSIEGVVGVGIDLVNDGAVLLRASRLSNVAGVPMRLGPASRPQIRQNVFRRVGPSSHVAVKVSSGAVPEFTGNVFIGFAEAVEEPVSRWPQFQQHNVVIRGPGNGR